MLSLWSILLLTEYGSATAYQTLVYLAVCSTVIGYEVVLGVVRVQDYYRTYNTRYYIRGELANCSLGTMKTVQTSPLLRIQWNPSLVDTNHSVQHSEVSLSQGMLMYMSVNMGTTAVHLLLSFSSGVQVQQG